jgi:hypothetical protein
MKKAELIKCFYNDKAQCKFKSAITKIVDNINKISNTKLFVGVENNALYVLDSEYHIFCEKKHLVIRKEEQDPWLPNYYVIKGGGIRRKNYCYNFTQLENDIKERLSKLIYR